MRISLLACLLALALPSFSQSHDMLNNMIKSDIQAAERGDIPVIELEGILTQKVRGIKNKQIYWVQSRSVGYK